MPDSGGHREQRGPRKRVREIVLNERDEAIFTLALKQKFPDITFAADHHERDGGDRPCASIVASDSFVVWACIDRQWSPELYVHIVRSRWNWGKIGVDASRWAWDPPTLERGSIGSSYMPGDEVARCFIQTVWRIAARIATNRAKGGHPLGNILEGRTMVRMADEKGGMIWYGHQALAWCHEGGERRMLNGTTQPCDDWEIPKDRWYQDLMRRAMETEGWNAKTLRGSPPGEGST